MNERKYPYNSKNVTVNIGEEMIIPTDADLEAIVLGSLLIEPDSINEVIRELNDSTFFKHSHKLIWKAMLMLYQQNISLDLVTVAKQLRNNQDLEEAGGAYYLSTLTNRIAGTGNLQYHVRLLQQDALKRRIIQVAGLAMQKCVEPGNDVFDIHQNMMNELDTTLSEVLTYEVERIDSIHNRVLTESLEIIDKGGMSGVPSGYSRLDILTNGFQKSDFIVIAGRPGMGKTAFVVSMARNSAVDFNEPVAIFSLEMSKEQLTMRLEAAEAEMNGSDIVKKKLSREQLAELENRTKSFNRAPLYIDDTASISLIELKSKARKLVKEKGVKMIIIDYLQLMTSGMNISNREQEISTISRNLKALAKELDIPIIALSQLSRSVETRGGDKRPMLSDLRESGAIEQDADMVLFCYRPFYYGFTEYEIDNQMFFTEDLFCLIVAKHRNGGLGEIVLKFIAQYIKITNYESEPLVNKEKGGTFVQHKPLDNKIIQPNGDFEQSTDEQAEADDLPF